MRTLKELWALFDLPEKDPKDLTEEELRFILDNNEDMDPMLLALVCSECLRRTWKKDGS